MAPPPPMPNGNLSNGIAKPVHIITPQNNSHAGLLKEIETGLFIKSFESLQEFNAILRFRHCFKKG